MSNFFIELSLVMILVLFVSIIMTKIKQPLLIGYIFTGIIAGPLFFNILSSNEGYETFAHIGIALLLFIVGLHLNLKLIKEVGTIALITGVGQVVFTSIVGFLIAYLIGFSLVASILIAIALTFSSTIIIVKLLSDKKDLETLYGKISMGFLIVQDLIAVVILMVISSFLNPVTSGESLIYLLSRTVIFAILAVILTYIFSSFILPKFLNSISKSTELLFIFIIAWCFGVASIFTKLGFSLEIGALLAGVALASSPYQFEISARIKPLRDFFIVMFFILLGSQMIPPIDGASGADFISKLGLIYDTFSPILIPAIIFSLFVLIGNPLIVLFLMGYLGYSSRTGFLAGLTVAQISEFSLILAMLGQKAGFLSQQEVSLITLVGIITITGSTYMILNGNKLYSIFEKRLKIFEKKILKDNSYIIENISYEVVIFGYDRLGYSLLKSIKKLKLNYVIVDYNPQTISNLKSKNISCVYGDAGDIDFLSEFNLDKLKLCVSTIPSSEINSLILRVVKEKNSNATIILTSNDVNSSLKLYTSGADYVILPHFLGGHHVSTLIEKYNGDFNDLLNEKIIHINELKERKAHGFQESKS